MSVPARRLVDGITSDAAAAGFTLEPSQRSAAERLGELGAALAPVRPRLARRRAPRSVYLRTVYPRSVYLHGPVGRGKSWVMDSFYRNLQVRKRRVHFHDFFRQLHRGTAPDAGRRDSARVRAAGSEAGGAASGTAIQRAVDGLLADIDVLCFDEFHVHDVGDGMFVARLLKTAAQRRVPLVVTSNYAPEQLLPNPLWHDHFVPTISVIKEMMDIVEINGETDFRRTPPPGDDAATANAAAATPAPSRFSLGRVITPGSAHQLGTLGLFPPSAAQQRIITPGTQPVTAKSAEPELLWVTFDELCGGLTSTPDYLALAAAHSAWVIEGVPYPLADAAMGSAPAWQRFTNVVDVLHECDVTLFLLTHGPLDWVGKDWEHGTGPAHLPVDMARTVSRLGLLGRLEGTDEDDDAAERVGS